MFSLDDAINRLSNCNPLTKEDEETFRIAIDCMKFTGDFLALNASLERMKCAINLLNSVEYILHNNDTKSMLSAMLDKYAMEDNKSEKF